jgi:putative spermidine/putrescine transport system permease protein
MNSLVGHVLARRRRLRSHLLSRSVERNGRRRVDLAATGMTPLGAASMRTAKPLAAAGFGSWSRVLPATFLLLAPAVTLCGVVFLLPVINVLVRGFSEPDWGLQNFAAVVEGAGYLRVVGNTLVVALSVTVICALAGYPLAYAIANAPPARKRLLIFLVLVPFWTSALVRTFAWMILLQKTGFLNSIMLSLGLIREPLSLVYNRTGVLIGMTHVLLPFMILPMWGVMSKIDTDLSKAASSLGATPVRNFLRVYLPLSMPGVIGGSVLVFTMSLGFFITPSLLGGPRDVMISQLIQRQVADFGQWGVAGALSLILIAVTGLAFVFMPSRLSHEAAR